MQVTWSGQGPACDGSPISGTSTFTSPGPSAAVEACPGTLFSFEFPASVEFGGLIFERVSVAPPSPLTTGLPGTDSSVLAGYALAEDGYDWTGFSPPVDNPPTQNTVNAGRTVQKFSLGGDWGLDVLAAGSPQVSLISCAAGAPEDRIEQTVAGAESRLQFDPEAGQYIYLWKTSPSWAGTCRQIEFVLNDGTHHTALFRFN